MNLYEISAELMAIYAKIEADDGEIGEGIEAILNKATMDFEHKVENIGKLILNLQAQEKGVSSEIDRLSKRKLAINNTISRLKEYAKLGMECTGMGKLSYGTFTVAVQKNPPSLVVEDEGLIPEGYTEIVSEKRIKKADILKDLKAGKAVAGCVIDDKKTHLRIR